MLCTTGRKEAVVLSRLEKLGATVTRDEKQPGKPVVAVSLFCYQMTDADLMELAAFKNLRKLSLRNTYTTTGFSL